MLHSVTSFLRLVSVYDALSDKFPEHWTVFVMHSVTSFLRLDIVYDALIDKFPDTRQCL